ncbi:MAG: glycosyltransferase family 2 protein [Solirubrobacteraceae bacterium]
MRIATVVCFLNEANGLGRVLTALEAQSRPPDRLLLVDDGSTDASPELADAFAARVAYARTVRRPARPPAADRLAEAAELRAFQAALAQLDGEYDVIAKLDADIVLTPEVIAAVENAFAADPELGITGPYLSVTTPTGTSVRERCPQYHVRGAVKFYRGKCLDQIAPLPPILGWDTIDEVGARLNGWRTGSFAAPGGDPVHLRPTGAHDGHLRAFYRWGACAYAIGDHPAWLVLGALRRGTDRPWGAGGLAYLAGWAAARSRRAPRAQPEVRAHARREQVGRLRRLGPEVLRRPPRSHSERMRLNPDDATRRDRSQRHG